MIAQLVDGDLGVAEAFTEAGFEPMVIGDAGGVGYLEGAIHAGGTPLLRSEDETPSPRPDRPG